MTAIPISNKFKSIDVLPADKYVKYVFKNATYMACFIDYTLVLMPYNVAVCDIEDGMLYRYFTINKRLYESSYTSCHNELLKLNITKSNDEIRHVVEQLRLF